MGSTGGRILARAQIILSWLIKAGLSPLTMTTAVVQHLNAFETKVGLKVDKREDGTASIGSMLHEPITAPVPISTQESAERTYLVLSVPVRQNVTWRQAPQSAVLLDTRRSTMVG